MAMSHIEVDPDGDVDLAIQDANQQDFVWPAETAVPEPTRKSGLQLSSSANGDSTSGAECIFRVSAGRLSEASPVFKSVLDAARKQRQPSSTGSDEDRLQITATKWNIEALSILLGIIHGRPAEEVPATVSLDQLTKIAVLVNHYKCHDAVEVSASRWIAALLGQSETAHLTLPYGREAMMWLFIAWVFGKEAILSQAASIAILGATGPMETMGLPIPGLLVFTMDNARHKAIEDILDGMLALRNALIEPGRKCPSNKAFSAECTAMLLGHLEMFVRELGVRHDSQPARPFYGVSVRGLTAAIEELVELQWREDAAGDHDVHRCGLRGLLRPLTKSALAEIPRLTLKGFPESKPGVESKEQGCRQTRARRYRVERRGKR
ncbi:hypothetical protein Micbo1qcDRAFT_236104 [Microdochium bolleyi]|uniref:BTB domain-containing protein n=1 Tax=Microdochium bolleyi TaxID=196109 RepID=A0A136ISR0_9PEZI|nr:hypothetical protein Micbo1qcDRAFT_236104 [Microdochium bolleyi]